MTTENLFQLAQSGELHLERCFTEKRMPGYCMAAAIDCIFEDTNVPVELYRANDDDNLSPEQLCSLIGRLAFGVEDSANFVGTDYVFKDIEEFIDDLKVLRGKSTILLITLGDGSGHASGLKPVGDNPDEWQLVGIDQVEPVAYSPGYPLQIHYERDPEVLTTKQAWEYLCSGNPAEQTQQIAYVFPPERQEI